jgi:hypothetical protein
MAFRGQTENITANGQMTTPWTFGTDANGFYNASIFITGTWSGTLVFEVSTDSGATWNATSLLAGFISGGTHVTGSSTAVNGLWLTENLVAPGPTNRVRVRASSWSSGSAEVRVGVAGGQAPANFTAGSWTGLPTRMYFRVVHRQSANWTDGGNTGTKGVFFLQLPHPQPEQRSNHYLYQKLDGFGLQQNASNAYERTATPPNSDYGQWLDCEVIMTAGTPGGSDGTARIWVNGTLVVDVTGVPFFASLQTIGWRELWVDPTYGGGARPAPYNMFLEYAYFYRESAP